MPVPGLASNSSVLGNLGMSQDGHDGKQAGEGYQAEAVDEGATSGDVVRQTQSQDSHQENQERCPRL